MLSDVARIIVMSGNHAACALLLVLQVSAADVALSDASNSGTHRKLTSKDDESTFSVWTILVAAGFVFTCLVVLIIVVIWVNKDKWKDHKEEIINLRENSAKFQKIFVRQTEIHDQFVMFKEEHYEKLQKAHCAPNSQFRQKFQQYEDEWRIITEETVFHYKQMKAHQLMLPESQFKVWHFWPPFFRIKYEDILVLNTSRQLMYKMIGKLAAERNKLFKEVAPEDVPPIPELPFKLDDSDVDIHFVRQLESMTHPKLSAIKIMAHGVFGELPRDSDKIKNPKAVIVNPLAYEYLVNAKSIKNIPDAQINAKSISRWLNEKVLPAEVANYFKGFDSKKYVENTAMFFTHSDQRWIIHCKSPTVDSISKTLDDIATLYKAIIELYIYALKIGEVPPDTKLHISPFSTENFIVNRALLPHLPLLTRAAWALAMARMPIEELKPLTKECISLCVLNPREVDLYQRAFDKGIDLQAPFQVNTEMNEVIRKHSTHHWIRSDNKGNDRLERLMACFQTLSAAWNGGYVLPDRTPVPLTEVQEMVAGTEFFLIDDANTYMSDIGSSPSYSTVYTVSLQTSGVLETAMEVAHRRARHGYRVCAINAASAYHCGGGSLTGGRHALEESWCVGSTLLISLLRMVYLAHKESQKEKARQRQSIPGLTARHEETLSAQRRRKSMGLAPRPEVAHGFARDLDAGSDHVRRITRESTTNRGRRSTMTHIMKTAKKSFLQPQKRHFEAYLPVQGVVLSPNVELFRKTSGDGYAFMVERQKLTGIISMAGFNRNSKIADSPVDAPKDKQQYESFLTDKWRSAVVGAIKLGCEVLIIPDVGCGVFKNDPAITGDCLNVVLCELHGHFREVILLGKEQFTHHATRSLNATSRLTRDHSEDDKTLPRRSRASVFVRHVGSAVRRTVMRDGSSDQRQSTLAYSREGRDTVTRDTRRSTTCASDKQCSTRRTNYTTSDAQTHLTHEVGFVHPTAMRPMGVGMSSGPGGPLAGTGADDLRRSDLELPNTDTGRATQQTEFTTSTKGATKHLSVDE